jgi:hypothetical protein
MLGSEAITTCKQRLTRNTAAGTNLDTWILDEMKAAQTRLEHADVLPWFLIAERSYEEITSGEERVLVPNDFLMEVDDEEMQVEDTASGTFTELGGKWLYDELKRRYPDEEEGDPVRYALLGQYFRLRPIPKKTTLRLWMTYFAEDAVIATGADNNLLKHFPDLIIAEAGAIIATATRNELALGLFEKMKVVENVRLAKFTEARSNVNFDPNPED